jgi:hypothetical protein
MLKKHKQYILIEKSPPNPSLPKRGIHPLIPFIEGNGPSLGKREVGKDCIINTLIPVIYLVSTGIYKPSNP